MWKITVVFILSMLNSFNKRQLILLFLLTALITVSSCGEEDKEVEEEVEKEVEEVVKKLGFIDNAACNFNSDANEDNGSCFYDCLEATLYGVRVDDRIVKINPNTGKIINSLSIETDPNYEEGLAISDEYLYYINGMDLNKIIVIDTALTEILDTLQTNFPPRIDALAINENLIYALDFLNNEMLVVNLLNGNIEESLALSFPGIGGICYAGNRGTIFISSFNLSSFSNNKIYEVNAETAAVINSFDVPYSPFGLAYSNADNLLFVSTGSLLGNPTIAVSPDNGQEVYSFSGSYSALAGE